MCKSPEVGANSVCLRSSQTWEEGRTGIGGGCGWKISVGQGLGWGPRQGVGVLLQFTGKEAELLSGTPVSVHVGEAAGIPWRALSPVTQWLGHWCWYLRFGECGLNLVSYQREGLGVGHKTANHSQNPFLPVTETIKSKTSDYYCKGCRDKLLEHSNSLINSS